MLQLSILLTSNSEHVEVLFDFSSRNIRFISNSSLSKFQFNLGKVFSDEDDWENAVVLWKKALEAMEDVWEVAVDDLFPDFLRR